MRENLPCILTRTLVREDGSALERSKCYLDFGQYSHTLYQVRIRYARYKKILEHLTYNKKKRWATELSTSSEAISLGKL